MSMRPFPRQNVTSYLRASPSRTSPRAGSCGQTPRLDICTAVMDLSDEISLRADDVSTLKEFFESDPAIELQIRRCFAKFLQGYRSEGEFVYLRLIQDLCLQNRNSLEVSYMHLAKCSLTLAIWLVDCPAVVLNNFNLSARTVAERSNNKFT